MVAIEKLRIEDVPAAGELLGRAFVEDPFFTYMDPNPTTRLQHVRWYLEANTLACVLLGGAYVTAGEMAGIALWIPPGMDYGEEILRASGLNERTRVFDPETEARFQNLSVAFGGAHQQVAPEPHYYLTILGVDPRMQGRGIGSALMQPVLKQADREGMVCYLETTRPRNIPFYKRHGFVAAEERHVEGVSFWPFRREPKAPIMSAQ